MPLAILRRSAAPVLAAVVVLAACTSSEPAEGPSPAASERAEAIVAARDLVVAPAQALGTAAAAVATRLDQLIADPDATTAEATRDALDELEQARDRVTELVLDAGTEDVEQADGALDDADRAASDLAASVDLVVGVVEDAGELDAELEDLAASWDEPGSRSQLLARFDEVATRADQLAEADTPTACPGPFDARTAAAVAVGEATRELRDLVDRRAGTAFDERRAELREAPWGRTDDGEPRQLDGRVASEDCPAVEDARAAAADVAAALRDLQEALNPADLAG